MRVIFSSNDEESDDGSTPNKRRKLSPKHNIASSDDEHLSKMPSVPTAIFAKYSEGAPIASDPPLVAQHRSLFMQRAFDDPNDKCISSLCHENELDHICYILKHWGGNVNLKDMQDDSRRKQRQKSSYC